MTHSKRILSPLASSRGSLTIPGSKSIANRALPLAAISSGTILLKNLPGGDDVRFMLTALKELGVSVAEKAEAVEITGSNGCIQSQKPISLFLGNSGTSMRFLTGILAAGKGSFELDGVPRMRERPIKDLVEGLQQWTGNPDSSKNSDPTTEIQYLLEKGFPPISITARGLPGGKAVLRGDLSSQFLTGMLLAMPLCSTPSEIEIVGDLVSQPYVDITLKMMAQWGCRIQHSHFKRFYIQNANKKRNYQNPVEYFVEADASSASYFLAAGAIGGGPVTIEGVGTSSLQFEGEGGFAKVLEQMGATVDIGENHITVSGGNLRGIDVNMDSMSDTGMTLAVTAMFAEGQTRISGIGNWRHKETDRLHAMAVELRKLGGEIEEGSDYLIINPPPQWQPAEIETYDDHRMAMCFSLTAFGGKPVTILDPECVNKTFPDYFNCFEKITSC